MALCMILRDSSSLSSPFFCDFVVELYTQDLVKFLRLHLFQDISRWRNRHQLRNTFLNSLFCGAGRILTTLIHSDRVALLYCFVWNYRKPGNIYLLEMALHLLLRDFCLFLFRWSRYHTDLEQMLKKVNALVRVPRQSLYWRSTSYIAIELNVLHLKSYEIQRNRCAQAILPLIVFLGID